jgi:hypothetical protein
MAELLRDHGPDLVDAIAGLVARFLILDPEVHVARSFGLLCRIKQLGTWVYSKAGNIQPDWPRWRRHDAHLHALRLMGSIHPRGACAYDRHPRSKYGAFDPS